MRYSKGQRLRSWTQLDPKQVMHQTVPASLVQWKAKDSRFSQAHTDRLHRSSFILLPLVFCGPSSCPSHPASTFRTITLRLLHAFTARPYAARRIPSPWIDLKSPGIAEVAHPSQRTLPFLGCRAFLFITGTVSSMMGLFSYMEVHGP